MSPAVLGNVKAGTLELTAAGGGNVLLLEATDMDVKAPASYAVLEDANSDLAAGAAGAVAVHGDELLDSAMAEMPENAGADVPASQVAFDIADASTFVQTTVGNDNVLLLGADVANVEVLAPPAVLKDATSGSYEGSAALAVVEGDELLDPAMVEGLEGTGMDGSMNPVVPDNDNTSMLVLTGVDDDTTVCGKTQILCALLY